MRREEILLDNRIRMSAALADSFFLRLRGLMGRDVNILGGLMLEPCSQIHCCFMKYPIDAVYIDRNGRVLNIEERLVPWTFRKKVKGCFRVLELPSGKAGELGIKEGTMIVAAVKDRDAC